jgi:hypothetical protein
VYSVTLNQVDPGISKYYIMQLIKCSSSYVVFKKWGSTGNSFARELDINTRRFSSLEPAVEFFEKYFKEKTGNRFADVHNFRKKPNKFVTLFTSLEMIAFIYVG